ncbi:MAG: ABC transporter ATP-binding protein [Kordiimonadales bacterium]|nr:MAG: ABC transporter ATP-binding protein [Kordiimonadales bacterium]
MLELRDISLTVDRTDYLSDISARFEPGNFNVLLGPTLAGKTSLLRIMAGLDAPTTGHVLFGGKDLTGVAVKKRSVAFVYQQFINYPTFSVFDNIASPLKVAKVSKADIKTRVGKIAELLAISPMLDRKPLELSGGQQQRVALARALVREADLVLLDEPLANLDYKLREELREELPRLFRETGSTVVYATTEPEEALLLGGHITLMHEGRVMQTGPTLEVYRNPVSLQSARTFSDPPLNIMLARRSGSDMHIAGLSQSYSDTLNLPDGNYDIGFRAHHLHVAKPSKGALSVKAVVTMTEITGSESFIHVEALGQRWTALTHGVHHHKAGAAIELFLDPRDFLLFPAAGTAPLTNQAKVA